MAHESAMKAAQAVFDLEDALLDTTSKLAMAMSAAIIAGKDEGVSTYIINKEISILLKVGANLGNAMDGTKLFHDNVAKVAESRKVDMTPALKDKSREKDNP